MAILKLSPAGFQANYSSKQQTVKKTQAAQTSFGEGRYEEVFISPNHAIRAIVFNPNYPNRKILGYKYLESENSDLLITFNKGRCELEGTREITEGYDYFGRKVRHQPVTDQSYLEKIHDLCKEKASKYYFTSEKDVSLKNY